MPDSNVGFMIPDDIKRPPMDGGLSILSQSQGRTWFSLVHGFDDIPSYCLEVLVTLRCKVIPGFRLIKRLSLIETVPLGHGDAFWSGPFHCNDLAASGFQIATPGSLLRSHDKGNECSIRRSIECFELA